jgi:hypothetical protein
MSRARKRERGAPSYVESWPLRATPTQRPTIETRFSAGNRVYNACLGEALARSARVKADPGYAAAKKLPVSKPKAPESTARREAFAAVDIKYGFTEGELQSFGSALRSSWVRDHVLAQEAQALAKRAFRAVHDYHLGKRGRPRFKSWRRGIRSLESKSREGSMRPVLSDEGVLTGFQWGNGLGVAPLEGPFRQPPG